MKNKRAAAETVPRWLLQLHFTDTREESHSQIVKVIFHNCAYVGDGSVKGCEKKKHELKKTMKTIEQM